MFPTYIIKGIPAEVKNKRILRIREALAFPRGTKENPTHNVITTVNGAAVFFDKPGKEYFRQGDKQNINDMNPHVADYFTAYSFKDVWKILLNLAIHLDEDSFKKLFVIIYRLAYLIDCPITRDGKVRFEPSPELMSTIATIQAEATRRGLDVRILEFLHFLDIVGWNEDVKYQSDLTFKNPRTGRINNILSMISIPLIFKDFTNHVIEHSGNLQDIEYGNLIDVAQNFSRTRGIQPISNQKLIEHLSPFLVSDR